MQKRITLLSWLFALLLLSNFSYAQTNEFTLVVDALYGKNNAINTKDNKDYSILLSEKVKELGDQSSLNVIISRTHIQLNQIEKKSPAKAQPTDLLIALSFVKAKHKQTSMAIFYPSEGEYARISKQFGAHLSLTFAENNIMMNSFKMEPSNHFSMVNSGCPSILMEIGYIGNVEGEASEILSDKNQYEIAAAIMEAVEVVATP